MTALGLSDADAAKAGKPRLLGVDNAIYVPVNKVIEIDTTGADVIHCWAMPQMGVKMDAVPGRINHTWFKADPDRHVLRPVLGTVRRAPRLHADRVHVVSDADYAAWLATSKKKYAALDERRHPRRVEIGKTAMTDPPSTPHPTTPITAATTRTIPPAGAATSIRPTTRTSARCT